MSKFTQAIGCFLLLAAWLFAIAHPYLALPFILLAVIAGVRKFESRGTFKEDGNVGQWKTKDGVRYREREP